MTTCLTTCTPGSTSSLASSSAVRERMGGIGRGAPSVCGWVRVWVGGKLCAAKEGLVTCSSTICAHCCAIDACHAGRAAAEALNTFYYLTYEGNLDLDAIADPTLVRAGGAVHHPPLFEGGWNV